MIRIFTVLTIAACSVGCASSYTYERAQLNNAPLDRSQGVLISTPENGWYGGQEFQVSGATTARAVRAAFARYANLVDVVTDCHGVACLHSINSTRYGYYVDPTIVHWEERATEWSGKSDKIEIRLVIYDTSTKQELATGSYSGKSKWVTLGGDHPQDLLPEPTANFVRSLYGP
jgi:hypothetical protein